MNRILVWLGCAFLFAGAAVFAVTQQRLIAGISATLLLGLVIVGARSTALRGAESATIDRDHMPPAAEIKAYRRAHPGTSIPEAIVALQSH